MEGADEQGERDAEEGGGMNIVEFFTDFNLPYWVWLCIFWYMVVKS